MKKCLLSLFISMTIICTPVLAQNLKLTIYNSNFGVVSETRNLDLKKGIQEISVTDVPSEIIPESIRLKFGGKVIEQSYQYDLLNITEIFYRYIDKEVILRKPGSPDIKGTLLSIGENQLVVQDQFGGLTMVPKFEEYQISVGKIPDGFVSKPTLKWLINADKDGRQEANLTYQTGAMIWNADYTLLLSEDEKSCDINSWVSIMNQSGRSYKDAKINLVAGEVAIFNHFKPDLKRKKRNYDYGSVALSAGVSGGGGEDLKPELFSEYYYYSFENPTTINNNETKQLNFFSSNNIKVEKIYQIYSNNYKENDSYLISNISFRISNSKKNNLGDPLPRGIYRVYKKNKDGELTFLGEDENKYTPSEETFIIQLGEASNVISKMNILGLEKAEGGLITTYQVTISNRTNNDNIEIDLYHSFGGGYYQTQNIVTESNCKYENYSLSLVKFPLVLKLNEEKKVIFKIKSSDKP